MKIKPDNLKNDFFSLLSLASANCQISDNSKHHKFSTFEVFDDEK